MFTGLVQHIGKILAVSNKNQSSCLHISAQFTQLVMGESIAVDGICVTVTGWDDHGFFCALSSETLSKTIAPKYRLGQLVNLERALRLSDRLGGHIVLGHIDTTVSIADIAIDGNCQSWVINGVNANDHSYLIKNCLLYTSPSPRD